MTLIVEVQPEADDVNVINDVPEATPVTVPPPAGPGVTVAILLVVVLQVPATELLSWVAEPAHTDAVPVIIGATRTVTVVVTEQPPLVA